MAETTLENGATIRHARRDDVPTILALIKDLATYENALSSVEATEETLSRTLSFEETNTSAFTPGYAKTLLLTDPDSREVAGLAVYFYNFSTWTGVPGIYLEDLYVREADRKKGYGKALIRALAREVVKVGGKRLEWSCLDWNESSLKFYEGLGAKRKGEWVGLRVEGRELEEMGAQL
ncbi:GCN5-related N-acetyltransferas-like protein [Aaosphaeria arxii CBS 175.79]|uniref:GCN5-related N-acetyltransferas-like protein n=1 Tax=Aaosphaeria arxii CBS 175.79 TaxID=1450172 RepID=A0A6A5XLY5_9PLEO|nr:GCN5-related N-acetyltransferas-like protein [Aaosphaeria arxii CBS 175.79]KAF2014255.1 GCN5-related N-acetyltransferas-like protein [Aaosphaeria arxii CBS 175.79]